ncbi:Uu.00g060290.m01.CDS01 [Anthostomella pinea]|uniref:Uu.00g060290.m01.CDS01 n=1 Tax=Anthostomella pinea TaxID=933095 RepID=A0AAI8YMG8_9PEZI|nr:Uu.00g060290.m01.CDS01 [Anthostomella pinea]
MLNSFLRLQKTVPEKFTIRDMIAASYINVITAHDVVAITLRAVVYYLAKDPGVQKKLQKEISDAEAASKLSTPAKYSEITSLSYLIFGEDSRLFNPERWIERELRDVTRMKSNVFTFGAGARNCIGKNLAMMQLTKIIVELYRHFDVKLAGPDKEWSVSGGWLTRQSEMETVLTKRE